MPYLAPSCVWLVGRQTEAPHLNLNPTWTLVDQQSEFQGSDLEVSGRGDLSDRSQTAENIPDTLGQPWSPVFLPGAPSPRASCIGVRKFFLGKGRILRRSCRGRSRSLGFFYGGVRNFIELCLHIGKFGQHTAHLFSCHFEPHGGPGRANASRPR